MESQDAKEPVPVEQADTGGSPAHGETAEPPELLSPENVHGDPTDHFYARFGTFMLAAPCETPDKADLQQSLIDALRADNRIAHVNEPKFRPDWVNRQTVWPRQTRDTSKEQLLSGEDHIHAIRLSDPFTFSVVVPKRNQPLFRGVDDVPTDTYYVAWDGMMAVVLWDREPTQTLPPRSGGHVVIEVLSEALENAGLGLYAQACSPGCTNVFAHRVLRIERFEGQRRLGQLEARGFPVLNTHLHSSGDKLQAASDLLRCVSYTGDMFAKYKNLSGRIRDIESLARSLADDLLELHYARLQRARLKIHKRMKPSWQCRGERAQSRELVAELWLALSRVESLKRSWDELRHRFIEALEESQLEPLYRDDFGDDDKAVESINLSFVRAAVEQSATRQDTRAIALATIAGGAAGLAGSGLASLLD